MAKPVYSDPSVSLYARFLEQKRAINHSNGKEAPLEDISNILYPFQRQLVQWALRKGRSAIFADTGLGKTLMQLEWANLTEERTLIVAPLAVAIQTVQEAKRLGLEVTYARSQEQAESAQIVTTNYEMLSAFEASAFGAVVLDESSILKSIDGKTKDRLIAMFAETPYRLCCTATPAPNDIAEFANHAAFLGICTREELLAEFFVHDDDGWRLKGHAKEGFYRWLASWAMMLKHPQDIGFTQTGFVLPPLSIEPVWVNGNAQAIANASGRLFLTDLGGITGRSAARRTTISEKVAAASEIINASAEQWIVWCGLNEEGRTLEQSIKGAVNLEGSDSLDVKVDAIQRFIEGGIRVLVTKTKIAGFGLNLQHCHNMLFLGLNDSYESYYQAIRRCWRHKQANPVTVKIVMAEIERSILENVMRKEKQAEEVSRRMVESVAGYEMEALGLMTHAKNDYLESVVHGEDWTLYQGDCVERLQNLEASSIDFTVFSPPFLSLYVYSDSERDIGNNKAEHEFFRHFDYFLNGMLRVMKPGRNVACHVSQVPSTLVRDGVIGLKDFRGKTIEAFQRSGFIYHGEVVIDKDPQAQAIRTKSKGLLFVQLKKDSSWLRPALADYILVFRKPGENAVPIKPDISNNEWIEWARPIWYGIRESDTLNVAEARSDKDERHIAPLQLGTIERCIRLWSNKGETVLSPFAGIGSEGYQAIKLGRKFIGIELKEKYADVAVQNLQKAEFAKSQAYLL